ncbi:hypothetical protein QYM36_001402 [Artemia franciscana]|uniref:Leucine-rich repeat-containing protein 14 n=1 Tax=Artemia franciscana TaxID=6661 RepID=A0AA88LC32_ARTSF|nr:hypothetical protein QYM36_001402 [Artemia franciscana]
MLVRSQELAEKSVLYKRNMMCQSDTRSLLSLAAKESVKSRILEVSVISSLPEGLLVVLLKEAVRQSNFDQCKRLINQWPHSKLDMFMIAKSCCVVCYQTFEEAIEEKVKFSMEVYFAAAIEGFSCPKEFDISSFVYDICDTNILHLMQRARINYRGTEVIKISTSLKIQCVCRKDVLEKVCRNLRSTFMKNEYSNIILYIKKFVFSGGCSLTCETLLQIFDVLPRDLSHLHVLNCKIAYKLTDITDYLKHFKHLVTLDFEGNQIGEINSSRELNYFGDGISELRNLQRLDLSNNFLPGRIEALLGRLNKGLTLLDLTGCKIDENDIFFLASSIHTKTITALSLSENDLSSSTDVFDFLVEEISDNVQFLYLLNTGLGPSDLVQCAEILSTSQTLNILDISSNFYEKSDLEDIMVHLAKIKNLKMLSAEWPQDLTQNNKEDFLVNLKYILLRNKAKFVCSFTGHLGKLSLRFSDEGLFNNNASFS